MTLAQEFNSLNGLIIHRKDLEKLLEKAEKEKHTIISKRIIKVLEAFADDTFLIEIKNLVEPYGLNGSTEDISGLLGGLEYISENDNEGLNKPVSPDDIYSYITDLLINTIKNVGHLPWQKEWKGSGSNKSAMNFASRKEYTGANFILNFDIKLDEKGEPYLVPINFTQPYYLTFNQIKEAKATLKKDSKARRVIYYTMIFKYTSEGLNFQTIDREKWTKFLIENGINPKGNKNISKIPVLKYYNVFRADDCTGLKFPELKKEKTTTPIQEAQVIIDNYPNPPKYTFGGDSAHYMPSNDTVNMPTIKAFNKEEFYYTTFFHELIHSTGAEKRLKRDFTGNIRGGTEAKKSYAFEELIAELGAVFLCAESGILFHTKENSAKYLKSWSNLLVSELENDNRFFLKASAKAQKGVNHILGREVVNGETPVMPNKVVEKTPKTPEKTVTKIQQAQKEVVNAVSNVQKKTKETHKKPVISNQLGLFGSKEISTEEFKNMTVSELRKFTLDYYNTNLKGKKIAIKNILKSVEFVGNAGKKTFKPMYSAKASVIEHLEELIKTSTYNNWGDRKPTDSPDVLCYLNFKSKITIDGIKRHVRISVILNNKRQTKLKGFEVGAKEEKSGNSTRAYLNNPIDGMKNPLSKDKDTKKGLNSPKPEIIFKPRKLSAYTIAKNCTDLTDLWDGYNEIEASIKYYNFQNKRLPAFWIRRSNKLMDKIKLFESKAKAKTETKIITSLQNRQSLANKIANKPTNTQYFETPSKHINSFLGKIERKEKESVVISLTGGQGSMKTRMAFQFMNAFAQNYNVGHASIEEHPESSLYYDKADQYLNENALQNIEAPEIKTIQELENLCKNNDVIVIDSFTKLQEMHSGFEIDKDLRKKYNGKLFIVIFQQTTDGKMRGGSKSQFDADIVLFTKKEADYRDNYIYADKNRYQNKPLDNLHYNIFSKQLISYEPEAEAQPKEKRKLSFTVN